MIKAGDFIRILPNEELPQEFVPLIGKTYPVTHEDYYYIYARTDSEKSLRIPKLSVGSYFEVVGKSLEEKVSYKFSWLKVGTKIKFLEEWSNLVGAKIEVGAELPISKVLDSETFTVETDGYEWSILASRVGYKFEVVEPRTKAETFPDHPIHQLTKREFFASLAMLGAIANPENIYSANIKVRDAVLYADALVEALNRRRKDDGD